MSTSALLDPVARNALPPSVLASLQLGMTDAIHQAYLVMAIAAVAGLVAVLWFPAVLPDPEPLAEVDQTPLARPTQESAASTR